MAVPNLIALLGLNGIVVREAKDYIGRVIAADAQAASPPAAG
jgi:Na+/alanine symporter